jgi:hypothetical protein
MRNGSRQKKRSSGGTLLVPECVVQPRCVGAGARGGTKQSLRLPSLRQQRVFQPGPLMF